MVKKIAFFFCSSFRASEHCKDTAGPGCKTSRGMIVLKSRDFSQIHSFQNNVVAMLRLLLSLKTTKLKSETDTPIFNSLLERGDLDFVEQLWVRMRKSESVPLLR